MITPASKQDIADVCTLAKVYETEYSSHVIVDIDICIDQYSKFVDSGVGCVFVLKKDGVVVGGIAGIKYPDLHSGILTAVETFWFVDKSHRGKGLLLLSTFEKWAKSNDCKRIAMIHLEDSHPVVLERLYIHRGYKLEEKHYVKEVC